MNEERQNPFAPNNSSTRYMNAYESAHARERMEQAMALADWSIRAWDGLRAALKRVGNRLRRPFVEEQRRADEAVGYRGLR
jgi:hypothetical protein